MFVPRQGTVRLCWLWGFGLGVFIFQAAYVIPASHIQEMQQQSFLPEGRNAVGNASITLISLATMLFKHQTIWTQMRWQVLVQLENN